MLSPWKKSYDQHRQHVKSRDVTLPTKVHLLKAMVFPVVMYGYENWAIKKAEHVRIDVFALWCWRRCFRVSWTVRRSIQSILKEISPEYSLDRLMLKLKLSNTLATWCKELLIRKDLDAGKDWRQEDEGITEDGMVGWHHWLNAHKFEQAPAVGGGQGSLAFWSPCSPLRAGPDWVIWTELWVEGNWEADIRKAPYVPYLLNQFFQEEQKLINGDNFRSY